MSITVPTKCKCIRQPVATGRRTKCQYQLIILHCTFQLWRTSGTDEGFHETCSIRHTAEREKIPVTWYKHVISDVYGLTARELAVLRWWILNSRITQTILQYILGKKAGKIRGSSVLTPNHHLQYHCDSTWQQFTILLPCCPATTYNIAVIVPGNCLQYYWPSIQKLFTIILDQYPATIYNITGLVSGNYLQ